MTEQEFNKNMKKMFFRLEKNIELVRENHQANFGNDQVTSLLFRLQEFCELMSDDYHGDEND